jgi:hypothetical protein
MKDRYMTKKQLIEELEVSRKQIVKLKKAETKRKHAEEALRQSEEKPGKCWTNNGRIRNKMMC